MARHAKKMAERETRRPYRASFLKRKTLFLLAIRLQDHVAAA
jgi:hypothetical protein